MLRYYKAVWPSGKAEDCKSFIPSSNLGTASNIQIFKLSGDNKKNTGMWWNGRHNRLKIC